MEAELLQIRQRQIPIRIVAVDAHAGTLARHESRDGNRSRTHFFEAGEEYERPVKFDAEIISTFRTAPPSDYYLLGPAPVPGGDNPGGTPAAVRAA